MKLENPRHAKRSAMNRRNGVAQLRTQAVTLGQDVRELAATAGQVARRQLDPLDEFVQAQPVKSLLIAAAVGAVLGVLFGRR